MHKWLGIPVVSVLAHGLVWMRSLSALFGVSAIAAVYYLNRVAFSPAAGLMGAAMMAVSPFGVYLSQEARHYILAMLLITLALLGLIQIQQELFQQQQLRFSVWLGKDITFIPRYHFVYYPSLVALIAASLVKNDPPQPLLKKEGSKVAKQNFYLLFFTFSCLSCVLVVSNFVFQKTYNPQLVAQNMNQELAVPLMVVVGYQDYQDVALGLSFALALEKLRSDAEFAFFKRSLGYEYVWQKLSQLQPPANQLNLWVFAPGLKQQDYPSQLEFNQNTCTLDFT